MRRLSRQYDGDLLLVQAQSSSHIIHLSTSVRRRKKKKGLIGSKNQLPLKEGVQSCREERLVTLDDRKLQKQSALFLNSSDY